MEELAELKRRFLEVLGAAHASCYPICLETKFPHVFKSIVIYWGTSKMDAYFMELLLTVRADRQGFPSGAAEEILRLHRLYHVLGLAQPDQPTPATGWSWVADVRDIAV